MRGLDMESYAVNACCAGGDIWCQNFSEEGSCQNFFHLLQIPNNHSLFLVLVMGKCEIHGNTYCFDSQLFWEEERFARTQAVAEKEMTQPEDLFL